MSAAVARSSRRSTRSTRPDEIHTQTPTKSDARAARHLFHVQGRRAAGQHRPSRRVAPRAIPAVHAEVPRMSSGFRQKPASPRRTAVLFLVEGHGRHHRIADQTRRQRRPLRIRGRGEPTLNPELSEMIRRCRDAFPAANLEMDTNAQHRSGTLRRGAVFSREGRRTETRDRLDLPHRLEVHPVRHD
jgi:hypothetical protein